MKIKNRHIVCRALCIVLSLLMLLTVTPMTVFAEKTETKTYKTGDIIEFGSYPQSEVTDAALKSALTSKAGSTSGWTSYDYYISGEQSDFMKYTDVEYGGEKYRGVYFTKYRPYWTTGSSSTDNSEQDDNGYSTSTVYWFKYEPMKWQVLSFDSRTGNAVVLSKDIIDSQQYYNNTNNRTIDGKTVYPNNYEHSDIRAWLNGTFYNDTFNEKEKDAIIATTLDNSAYDEAHSRYDSNSTTDKVWLLSYSEAQNTAYGFTSNTSSTESRQAKGSAYALCQGLWKYSSNGCSIWRLRSAGAYYSCANSVESDGYVYSDYDVSNTSNGVRPALKINLTSSVQKQIVVFSTEKTLSVQTGEEMRFGFGLLDVKTGLLDDKWKKMAVVVSDPTVVSLSDYSAVEYGYSLSIKGKKEGSTNLTVTDTDSGISTVIRISVYDRYIRSLSYDIQDVPKFYPENKWENELETNLYDLNGMYVSDYTCTAETNRSDFHVSFNVYNTNYFNGAVDIYDADGLWIDSEYIDRYSDISSLRDTGEQLYYLISDTVTGKMLTYKQASFSKKSSLSFDVPRGGYFTISNNMAQSPGTFFANAFEIIYDSVCGIIDFATSKSQDPTAFNKFFKEGAKSYAQNIIDSRNATLSKEVRKSMMEIALKSLTSEIEKIQKGFVKASFEDIVKNGGEMFTSIVNLAESVLKSYNISWKHLYSSSTGIAESLFTKFSGPAGIALKAMFAITKGTNNVMMAAQMARSMDNTFASFFSEVDEGFINKNGVVVNTNGNVDEESVLQVFKVSNDDTVEIILNADDPLEKYEIYNICFVKNDKLVQPNGRVKVYIPIPAGMNKNTCKVFRQEADKSWRILDAHTEGNYLVFETDHFSLYTVVGQGDFVSVVQLPSKTVYKDNETLNTEGLILSVGDEHVTEGFFCSPVVLSGCGNHTVTVSYAGLTASFNVVVEHTYAVKEIVNASCTENGYTLVACECGATEKRDLISPNGHDWGVWVVTTPATVGSEGVKTRKCKNCEATETETIKKLPITEVTVNGNYAYIKNFEGFIVTVPGVISDEIIAATGGNTKIYRDGKEVVFDEKTKPATGMQIVILSGDTVVLSCDIVVMGDIDCNGEISVGDARLALRAAVSLDNISGAVQAAASISHGLDEAVGVSDARLILRAAVSLDNPSDWMKNK